MGFVVFAFSDLGERAHGVEGFGEKIGVVPSQLPGSYGGRAEACCLGSSENKPP